MSLAKSFVWLTISEILFNISGYVVHTGAGRLLTPEDYGRYGLIVTMSIMVVALFGNGIPISMSKYLSEYWTKKPWMVHEIKRKGFILEMAVMIFVSLAFYLVSPIISRLLGDPSLTALFRISLFIVPAYALDSFYFYYMTGIQKFNIQSLLKIVRSVLRIIIIIGFIHFFQLKGAIAGYIFVPLIVFLISWSIDYFKISRTIPNAGEDAKDDFNWKNLFHYAWPVTLFMIFYEILISLDLYFIKALLHNDYLTGIYNASLTISRIPYYLFYALTVILLPTISGNMANRETEKARALASRSMRFLLMLILPMVTLMSVYAQGIIRFIFGNKYQEGSQSLEILSFGVGFLTIFYISSFILNGAGKIKKPMWTAFFGMVLNAILNYYLIRRMGIVGSAVATSISSFFVMSISLFHLFQLFGCLISPRSLMNFSFSSLIIFVASFFVRTSGLLFIPYALALFSAYFVLLYVLREFSQDDFSILKQIYSRKKPLS